MEVRRVKPKVLTYQIAQTLTIVLGPVESMLIADRVTVMKDESVDFDLIDWVPGGDSRPMLVGGIDF